MDPMYEKLENSLKIIYSYNDVYIERHFKTHLYIPYIGPETRSKKDLLNFIKFANNVINDYPKSQILKLGSGSLVEFGENEKYTHPCTLMIFRDDVDDINDKALKNSISSETNESCSCILL